MAATLLDTELTPHPRIVRYAELRPCLDAFIDTRTPGSDRKENFTIIGPGVSENPNQHVHIAEPHGFNIGGARQPPGCTNSQHSHLTEEVFFVHAGTWAFLLGEKGDDAKITLQPGDLISIPTNVFRGFENIGDDMGYLWAVLGNDDPGHVLWAPYVFDMAKQYGLVLLENGMLIDTANGEAVPDDARVMPVTSTEQVASLDVYSDEDLRRCCILAADKVPGEKTTGAEHRQLIGETGQITRSHGFSVSQFSVDPDKSITAYRYAGPEVIFVHRGEIEVEMPDETWVLGPGDTATIPKGILRHYKNKSRISADFVRVQGDL